MFDQITKFANEATTTATENFTSTSDQVLDAVLDANRRFVDFAVTTADRLTEQVDVELPFADRLPTPAETGERYLEFVERAVSLNRDMNQRVVEMIQADTAKAASEKVAATARSVADNATRSVTDAARTVSGPAAPKRPAKKAAAKRPARKSTAKKSTAKKSTARKSTAKKATAAG
jgi:cobalamin biosynthesis Mg chelatase CobN